MSGLTSPYRSRITRAIGAVYTGARRRRAEAATALLSDGGRHRAREPRTLTGAVHANLRERTRGNYERPKKTSGCRRHGRIGSRGKAPQNADVRGLVPWMQAAVRSEFATCDLLFNEAGRASW